MIFVGVDIEDNSRFLDKNDKFLSRIFTKKEIDYCLKYENSAPHFCARFCAKEAVIKALSNISDKKLTYSDIEILNKENGVPYVNLLNKNETEFKISLSISHEKEKSTAFVIVEV